MTQTQAPTAESPLQCVAAWGTDTHSRFLVAVCCGSARRRHSWQIPCCIKLQCIAVWGSSALQKCKVQTLTADSSLQNVAVHCSVLQCVAVVRGAGTHSRFLVAVYCSVLQCVAGCCSVLQGVAVCCSVLQQSARRRHSQLIPLH